YFILYLFLVVCSLGVQSAFAQTNNPYLECIDICTSPKVAPENFLDCYDDCLSSGGNCIPTGYQEEERPGLLDTIRELWCGVRDLCQVGTEITRNCCETAEAICEGGERIINTPLPHCMVPGYGLWLGDPTIRFRCLWLSPIIH
ncbi:MAG: hypothetical protein KDD55_02135, partial [Bdellovibrionales bacterium]|nr:hypothetical protein [Bdellovibrionales bacterium]